MAIWAIVFVVIALAVVCFASEPQRAINRRMSHHIRASRETLFGEP